MRTTPARFTIRDVAGCIVVFALHFWALAGFSRRVSSETDLNSVLASIALVDALLFVAYRQIKALSGPRRLATFAAFIRVWLLVASALAASTLALLIASWAIR